MNEDTTVIVRTVKVTHPVPGEIVVKINVEQVIRTLVAEVAKRAYHNATGKTNSVTSFSLLGEAELTPETITVRNAYLKLNNVPRENTQPTMEVQPE